MATIEAPNLRDYSAGSVRSYGGRAPHSLSHRASSVHGGLSDDNKNIYWRFRHSEKLQDEVLLIPVHKRGS